MSMVACTSSSNITLLRISSSAYSIVRNLLRPRRNIPFRGIYRTEGDSVRKDDLLVCQHKMNYHPGLNDKKTNKLTVLKVNSSRPNLCKTIIWLPVYLKRDRAGQLLLKAMTDGSVMITQEKINPDFSIPEMLVYEGMDEIYKLTFNVLPLDMSQSFRLLNEI